MQTICILFLSLLWAASLNPSSVNNSVVWLLNTNDSLFVCEFASVYGLPPLRDEKKKSSSKEKFITHKPQELKWDSKLFLPKEPWPTKSCSFTVSISQVLILLYLYLSKGVLSILKENISYQSFKRFSKDCHLLEFNLHGNN